MSLLIPLNKSKTKFEGIIESNSGNDSYHVQIEKSRHFTRIDCDWRLKHKLQRHFNLLEERLKQCSNIEQFFNELKLVLQTCVVQNVPPTWKTKYYDVLLQHLQNLGWNKIQSINEDFTEVKLKATDTNERNIILTLSLNHDYPELPPQTAATLPVLFEPLWTADSNLAVLYNQFKMFIQQFERFWDEVEELQEHTWILEPDSPNYAATSFRIALGKTSSFHIKVDPLNMGVVPECNFLGAEWAISDVREKFHEKYEEWNENLSLYRNFKNILEVDFPAKQHTNSQDISLHCGICYAFRLGASIPDQICNEKRCGQPFHHECLLEWLKSIPDSKQSFNIIFGECPYCTNSMKINVLRD